MSKILLTSIRNLTGNHFFISACAFFSVLQTRAEFRITVSSDAFLFFVFFATWTEYRIHRLRKYLYRTERFKVPVQDILFLLLTASAALYYVVLLEPRIQKAVVVPAIVTLLYSLPLISINGRSYGLREIPFIKTFVISIIWSYVTVWIPFMAADINPGFQHHLLAFARFFFILALTISFDVRDSFIDKSLGVRSIGQLARADRMHIIAALLLIPACMMPALSFILHGQYFISGAYLVSGLLSSVVLLNKKLRTSQDYHLLYVDGMIALQGAFVYMAAEI